MEPQSKPQCRPVLKSGDSWTNAGRVLTGLQTSYIQGEARVGISCVCHQYLLYICGVQPGPTRRKVQTALGNRDGLSMLRGGAAKDHQPQRVVQVTTAVLSNVTLQRLDTGAPSVLQGWGFHQTDDSKDFLQIYGGTNPGFGSTDQYGRPQLTCAISTGNWISRRPAHLLCAVKHQRLSVSAAWPYQSSSAPNNSYDMSIKVAICAILWCNFVVTGDVSQTLFHLLSIYATTLGARPAESSASRFSLAATRVTYSSYGPALMVPSFAPAWARFLSVGNVSLCTFW